MGFQVGGRYSEEIGIDTKETCTLPHPLDTFNTYLMSHRTSYTMLFSRYHLDQIRALLPKRTTYLPELRQSTLRRWKQ